MRFLASAALLVCSAALIHAQEVCPYMNSATAGDILGGPVTVAVTHAEKNKADATCQFARKSESSLRLLIEVATMANPGVEFKSHLAQCGSNFTPVRAVGNEAVACSVTGEQVIGRVRERAFLIRVSAGDTQISRESQREKALDVAEQVAGNLF